MKISLERFFRRMGLPLWTLAGIGFSALLFNYFGALLERGVKDLFGVNPQQSTYLSLSVNLFIPFFLVGVIWLFLQMGYQARRISAYDNRGLRFVEGKKALIILVSNPKSAIYAIEYHFKEKKTLETVWLIPSDSSDEENFGDSTEARAKEIKEMCKGLEEAEKRKLEVRIERSVSPADSQDTFDCVKRVFRNSNYKAEEIAADFTGGTKPMSVGMIMACLPSERELEYVSLNGKKESKGPFLIDYQHRAFDLIG
ncbi:MAG: hypothetical protein ACJ74G_12470 [Blastocatellia bacterium]